MTDLINLSKLGSKRRTKKRVGRGYGSGKGRHTSGRGQKGQGARETVKQSFEGGQQPLVWRLPQLPKFHSHRPQPFVISLGSFAKLESGQDVTVADLRRMKIIRKSIKGKVKILSNGDLKKKLNFKGFLASAAARKKIEAAGGSLS